MMASRCTLATIEAAAIVPSLASPPTMAVWGAAMLGNRARVDENVVRRDRRGPRRRGAWPRDRPGRCSGDRSRAGATLPAAHAIACSRMRRRGARARARLSCFESFKPGSSTRSGRTTRHRHHRTRQRTHADLVDAGDVARAAPRTAAGGRSKSRSTRSRSASSARLPPIDADAARSRAPRREIRAQRGEQTLRAPRPRAVAGRARARLARDSRARSITPCSPRPGPRHLRQPALDRPNPRSSSGRRVSAAIIRWKPSILALGAADHPRAGGHVLVQPGSADRRLRRLRW